MHSIHLLHKAVKIVFIYIYEKFDTATKLSKAKGKIFVKFYTWSFAVFYH